MNDLLFERLLYEEESTTLDFKMEQYRFAKAAEDEKSELLKDIVGFANAWRRAEAYILIGVEDIRGGRSNVTGIATTDHLEDHSLQQFVNNLTNRPVRFHYEAFGFEGKQVGIIRIEEQQARPIFLKRNYGKLKKQDVYVRRGSSTDPSKPASPDEIALMGYGSGSQSADLVVEFADIGRDESLGTRISWEAELCEMPDPVDIPVVDDTPDAIRLPGGQTIQLPSMSSLSLHDRLNSRYYHELANYIFFHKLFRKIRLVVKNVGLVAATDVRIELCMPNGQGFGIVEWADVPDLPEERESVLAPPAMRNLNIRPAFRHAGDVDVAKNEEQTKVEIECGSLQPGRTIWTDSFFMGIGQSGEIETTGRIFAGNLPQPREFTLAIDATIAGTKMTVADLLSSDKPSDQGE